MKQSWLFLLLFFLCSPFLSAQVSDPVKWITDTKDLGNNEFELTFKAKIDKGWCVYSQHIEEGGPIPCQFDFSELTDKVELIGEIQELGKAKEGIDPIFDMNVKKYFDKITFKAKVKTKQPETTIEIPLLYMSCDDEACVRLEEYFDFTLKSTVPKIAMAETPAEKLTTKTPLKTSLVQENKTTPTKVIETVQEAIANNKNKLPQTTAAATAPTQTIKVKQQPIQEEEKPIEVAKKEVQPSKENTSPKDTKPAASTKVEKTATKDIAKAETSKTVEKATEVKKETPKPLANETLAQNEPAKTEKSDVAEAEEAPKKKKKKKKKKKRKVVSKSADATATAPTPAEKANANATDKAAIEAAEPTQKVKKGIGIGAGSGLLGGGKSNILEPVKWSFEMKDLGDGEYLLNTSATIDDNWYVYSQKIDGIGPVPTSFEFDDSTHRGKLTFIYESDSTLTEISDHKKEGLDPVFEMNVTKYAEEVTFSQKVKLSDPTIPIKGFFRYMTCDSKRCLPPRTEDVIFSTKTSGFADEVAATLGLKVAKIQVDDTQAKAAINSTMGLIKDCGVTNNADDNESRAPWTIFFLGFLGGFAALLTPCVFPMIPLTVSFFTKQSKNQAEGIKNALIYAVSIIVIYVALGFLVTVTFGPETLNMLSTNPWFNLAFFAVFVIFAFSFFGFFEITLPSSIVNVISAGEDKGGLIGIFFMAFTLALVSFSCTGPIIGTLLVEAAVNGKQIGPILGMTGFAVALALPFALFAAFPGWLNSLPKSGGWLNSVKVVLGFIELIFALKFLSNADLVQQWGLLKRETFLIIWFVLLVALALYLLGRIKFPHDSPIKKLSMPRIGLAIVSLAAAVYLIPGIFCKSLPLVSGFPPPIFYSYGCGNDANKPHVEGEEIHFEGIRGLAEGMALAKKENKPILVDFTGWACVNCRKMEENVWPTKDVAPLIEQYTLVSLYVDEDIKLPKEERFTYDLNGKKRKVRTVGNKWSYLETFCFNRNSQPYYALITPDGHVLNQPVPFTPNTTEYAKFLQEGLDNFKAGKTLGQE